MNHCLTNNYNWWNSKPKTKWKCKTTAGQLVPVLIINLKSNGKDFWSQFRINIKPTQTSKLPRLQFILLNPSMIVCYWQSLLYIEHTLAFHGMNFFFLTSICASVFVLNPFPFQTRISNEGHWSIMIMMSPSWSLSCLSNVIFVMIAS